MEGTQVSTISYLGTQSVILKCDEDDTNINNLKALKPNAMVVQKAVFLNHSTTTTSYVVLTRSHRNICCILSFEK